MAKKSIIARERKRELLIKAFSKKREVLKTKIVNPSLSIEEREKAMNDLNKLPKNSSAVRAQNRCYITGRAHGVYSKFGLSRNKLRKMVMMGEIPGVRKSSW